jgi:aspartyl-tRNA synthetase
VTRSGFPRIPYDEAMRWYGTDKPDLRNPIEDAGRVRAFPRAPASRSSPTSSSDPRGPRSGRSRADGRQPRVLRPHELLGAGRGPAGPRLHLLARGERQGRGRRPDRQEHRRGAHRGDPRTTRPWRWRRRASLPPATRKSSQSLPAMRAPRRRGTRPDDETGSSSAGSSTSRCTNGTRTTRRSTFATTRSRCRRAGSKRSSRRGAARHLGLKAAVRPRLQRLRDRVGRIRNHCPRVMVKAFGIAGLEGQDGRGALRRLYRAFQYGAPPHGGMAPASTAS